MCCWASTASTNSRGCDSVGRGLCAIAAAGTAGAPLTPRSSAVHGASLCVTGRVACCPVHECASCSSVCRSGGHKVCRLGDATATCCVACSCVNPAANTVNWAGLQAANIRCMFGCYGLNAPACKQLISGMHGQQTRVICACTA
jgi:hypothetical protein